jgi:hypothetical protein
LLSVSSWTDKGDINKAAHGPNSAGFLTYTSDGGMIVIIAEDGRLLSVADRVSAPFEEKNSGFFDIQPFGQKTRPGRCPEPELIALARC